ncbi:MAG TPA: hypothetical protein DCY27_01695 [Desulfobacterales bacterium]|nr:hypothetical protein [Desulfobacterales bacterium]
MNGKRAGRDIPIGLSHRFPGMTGLPADLLDTLLINPVRRADIPIMIHLDHPIHGIRSQWQGDHFYVVSALGKASDILRVEVPSS